MMKEFKEKESQRRKQQEQRLRSSSELAILSESLLPDMANLEIFMTGLKVREGANLNKAVTQ